MDDSESDGFGACLDWPEASSTTDRQSIPISGVTGVKASSSSNSSVVRVDLDKDMASRINSDWESLVSAAAKSNGSTLCFPWERGIAAQVFTTGMLSPWEERSRATLKTPVLQEVLHRKDSSITSEEKLAEKARVESAKTLWPVIAVRLHHLDWDKSDSPERMVALRKWKVLVQECAEHCELGRKLVTSMMSLKDDGFLMQLITDTFARKGTLTLHKRADSIAKFRAWCKLTSRAPFPIDSTNVYLYVKSPNMQKPSAGQAMREALNFSQALIGMDGAGAAASDPLVAGATHQNLLRKRMRKQARLLTVPIVRALVNFCCDSANSVIDVVFIGHCLALMAMRSRWYDGQFPHAVEVDRTEELDDDAGYIQFDTTRHKTATTVAKKTMALQMVGPISILGNADWFHCWQAARGMCGLNKESNPMVPVVTKDGSFGTTALSSSQASVWLREVIESLGFDAAGFSSHSLKSCYLSWAAKFNLDLDTRTILGYHVLPGRTSTFIYGRDNLAGPLRELERMLDHVTKGTFDPDATRSGRFKKCDQDGYEIVDARSGARAMILKPKPKSCPGPSSDDRAQKVSGVAIKQERVEDVIAISDDDDESSGSSSSSASTSEPSDLEAEESVRAWQGICDRNARKPSNLACDCYLVHSRRYTVHSAHEFNLGKLKCGKVRSSMFTEFWDEPDFGYPRCKDCFGRTD